MTKKRKLRAILALAILLVWPITNAVLYFLPRPETASNNVVFHGVIMQAVIVNEEKIVSYEKLLPGSYTVVNVSRLFGKIEVVKNDGDGDIITVICAGEFFLGEIFIIEVPYCLGTFCIYYNHKV